MDGDGKLLKAVLLVACGVALAVFFGRGETPPAPPAAASSPGTLVRRTPSPIALDLQEDVLASSSSEGPAAAMLGGVQPQPASPADARPQSRLSAEIAVPAQGVAAQPAGLPSSPKFVARAPRNEPVDPDRTPLNNLFHAPHLPERFPGAETWPTRPTAGAMPPLPAATPSTSVPAPNDASDGIAKLTFGPSSTIPAAGTMTPISSVSKLGAMQSAPTRPQTTSSGNAVATSPTVEAPPRRYTPVKRHTVRDGDTLADLAKRYYGDDKLAAALYDANRGVLRDPELLPIGAVLTIPAREIAAPSAAAPAVTTDTPAARLVPKLEINAFGAPPTTAP